MITCLQVVSSSLMISSVFSMVLSWCTLAWAVGVNLPDFLSRGGFVQLIQPNHLRLFLCVLYVVDMHYLNKVRLCDINAFSTSA